jgi:hypothetical protein
MTMVMKYGTRCLVLSLVFGGACGDDSTPSPDGGRADGGVRDAGRRDGGSDGGAGSDAGSDAGSSDAGSDAGTSDGGSDAGSDSGPPPDAGDGCSPGCEPDFTCAMGRCLARCIFDGCAADTDVCIEDEGCRPAACTESECISLTTLHHCDSTTGCYDPCAPDRFDPAMCAAAGGRCGGGACVDDTCSGGTVSCGFRMDCCGNMICLDSREPDPGCPIVCVGTPAPAPRPSDCGCAVGGACVDMRFPS